MTENKTGAASRELGVMVGRGFYNKHSRPQRGAVAFGLPLLEHAVEAVPLPGPSEVFQVADYGVAGETTPWSRCDRSRRGQAPGFRRPRRLPTNDFDPLFSLLASPDSYLQGTCNVFAYAGGRSF